MFSIEWRRWIAILISLIGVLMVMPVQAEENAIRLEIISLDPAWQNVNATISIDQQGNVSGTLTVRTSDSLLEVVFTKVIADRYDHGTLAELTLCGDVRSASGFRGDTYLRLTAPTADGRTAIIDVGDPFHPCPIKIELD